MPKPKFCPFGFYSFYVSKEQAQAGGCHHCLEDKCALWESYYDTEGNLTGQCSIIGIGESLRSISESMVDVAEGKTSPVFAGEVLSSAVEAVKPARKLESFLDKIRSKKLAQASSTGAEGATGPQGNTGPSSETPEIKPVIETAPGPTGLQVVGVTQPKIDDLDALLNPPPIPVSELPIVSKNPTNLESPPNGEGL